VQTDLEEVMATEQDEVVKARDRWEIETVRE